MADPVSFTIALAVSTAIGFLFPAEGPRLRDLKVSASTYGASIPEGFGIVRIAANMIWSDKIREHKRKMMAGKGGFINLYTYTCSFAMGVCAGPITAVRRVWANNKLIYDASGSSEVTMPGQYRMRFYKGDELQMPDGAIEEIVGVGNTPAFRGLAYIVFDDCPLKDFGNQIPQIAVELIAGADAVYSATGPHLQVTPGGPTSFQLNNLAVDPERGYVYNHSIDFTTSTGYIRRWRESDGKEDYRRAGDISDANLMGVSPSSGDLMVQHGIANSVTFSMLDSTSFAIRGTVGVSNSSFTSPAARTRAVFSTTQFFEEYAFYTSLFGDWCVCRSWPTMRDYKIIGSNGGGVFNPSSVCGLYDVEYATFFIFEGGNSSGGYTSELKLHRVRRDVLAVDIGWTTTEILSIPNPIPDNGGINVGFGASSVHFDEADGGLLLIWNSNNRVMVGKWDLIVGAWKWQRDVTGNGFPDRLVPIRPIAGRIMWAGSFTSLYVFNTLTGEFEGNVRDRYWEYHDPKEVPLVYLPAPSDNYSPIASENFSIFAECYYDPLRDALVVTSVNGTFGQVMRLKIDAGASTLADFVERVLRRAGLGINDFDVSALAATELRGFGWANGTDVKSVLDQMRMLFLFDLIETNGKLVAVLRDDGSNPGSSLPVRTVPQKLLGGSPDAMDFWQETRIQEADVPSRVSLTYMNIDDDFQTSTVRSARISEPVPTMFSRQQVSAEMNVVMKPTQAKDQVNKILWTQWSERTKHATHLPWTYLALDPADVIGVKMDDGRSYLDRIHVIEIGADYALATESFSRDAGAYDSHVTQADGGGSGPSPPIVMPTPARPFILNTPLLRDIDDTKGAFSLYYTGVGSATSGKFHGAALFRSVDGLNFTFLYGADQDIEWGIIADPTPAPRHGDFALDWETKIVIWPGVDWFALESTTDDLLWQGANLCMVGDEVIQFRDAVENPDGTWTISNLLRGRRGTEYACATHGPGETFAFLSADTITGEGETLDARGQRRFFKAVGEGRLAQREEVAVVDYEPRDLMPYAPKDIRRTIAGSTITLSWSRRTRLGGNMQDGTGSVPLHEADESYEAYVLAQPFTGDLSRGNTVPLDDVVFQAETTVPQITFDVSQITAPFDVDLDTLHVVIYQKSASVGRGFPGARSIQPWRAF